MAGLSPSKTGVFDAYVPAIHAVRPEETAESDLAEARREAVAFFRGFNDVEAGTSPAMTVKGVARERDRGVLARRVDPAFGWRTCDLTVRHAGSEGSMSAKMRTHTQIVITAGSFWLWITPS